MPTVNKITPFLFNQLKTELESSDPITVAIKNKLSMKTILQIKGSENFHDYEQQKQAQHPPTTSTMRDDVKEILRLLRILVDNSKENRLL